MSDRKPAVAASYRESHIGTGADYHEKFISGPYRSVIWQIEREKLLGILQRRRPESPVRLLDFACGTGRVIQLLETQVDSATGVDISESMLDVAKSNTSRSTLIHADITRERLFDGQQFEIITAFRFFPNAEPELREEVMRELARLLSGNGILVINNHLRCKGTRLVLRRLVQRLTGKYKQKDLHCMSDTEVSELVSRHGLAITEMHHLSLLPILKEKRPLLPKFLIRGIERTATRFQSLAQVANIRIYVLQHQPSNTPEQPAVP